MTLAEAFEAAVATLVGQPISHIWRGHGSALFLEFGALSPRPRRDGKSATPEGVVSLGVQWSWRIEDRAAILCGSWSDADRWGPALELLRDARVARCELFGALPEIAITMDSGIRFLSFSTTDGQPQWHLIDRRDGPARWFSVRGGQLHLGDGNEPVS